MNEKINQKAATMNGKVLAIAWESKYIAYVIVEFNDAYEKFVCWLWNDEFEGFYNGIYSNDYKYVIKKFAERLTR